MSRDDAQTPGATDAQPAVHGLRVLVVDGSEEGRRSIGLLLRSFGMQPTLMAQAQPAIDELRRAAREQQPYALLLFDSTLRGSVVFRARRAQDDPLLSITPRIELASQARQGAEAPERGPLLHRPVTRDSLLAALDQALASAGPPATQSRLPPPARPPAPGVLLLEPDPVSALVASRLVELAGGVPVVAHSLDQALAAVENVDVALLDATLSEVAMCLESLRRARPELRILGWTGPGAREAAAPADGFEAYLDETLDAEQLRTLLEPRTPRVAAPVAPRQAAAYDRRLLASRLGDDEAAAQQILVRFAEQAGARLRELAQAAASADGHAIELQAHRLRGGLSWIGADRAASVAGQIEGLARAGDTKAAAELLETLRDETERVVAEIRAAAGPAKD